MLKGFKDFIMRGNVIDLAVGVVIGAAFTALVTSFTTSFLTPLINMVGANGDTMGGVIELPGGTADKPNGITYGAFISAIIAFLLTAAVVYFLVVLPMNKFAERFKKNQEEPAPALPTEEIQLLREIRDALVAGKTPQPRRPQETAAEAERA
ncbi:MAG: large-conductance mechanosensitive channel protein MscL [Hamadaea sp.]|nr:large-conductance mechanosensitive channel protein MscL [Hamadaea sp.]